MKEKTEQRSQGTKAKGCPHQEMQTPEGGSQCQPQGGVRGDLNTLNNRVKQVIQQSGVNDTPENRCLAYMSIVSSNSIKVMLTLVLSASFGGLSLAVETQRIY